MMRISKVHFAILLVPWTIVAASAQDVHQEAHEHLKPRTITLPRGVYDMAEVLKQLEAQTGNRVIDGRRDARGTKITIGLERATFWHALEQITRQAGCGFSPHHEEGVALTDTPLGNPPVSHHGIFRFALKRVQTTRDEALASHWCHVTIEMMWEPRFDPVLYDLTRAEAEFSADASGMATRGKSGRGDRTAVRGRKSVELEMRFPAPPRSASSLVKLAGNVHVQGPSRTLTFRFDRLQPIAMSDPPRSESKDGVVVSLTRLQTLSSLWTVQLSVKSPPIQGPPFESHQADLRWAGLAVFFERTAAGKRVEWQPSRILPGGEADVFVCPFRDVQDKKLGDWELTCRVPGVIVELSAPFEFRDVPLP